MTSAEQLNLRASMAQWPQAQAFVEAFCARHGIARTDMLRLTLVAEELFTNSVEHGHAGGADAIIRFELDLAPGALRLMFEDKAPPFDPLAHARAHAPDLDAAPDARPVGGLGLHLVEQLATEARYAREEGCNRLWVTLALEAAAGTGEGAVLPR